MGRKTGMMTKMIEWLDITVGEGYVYSNSLGITCFHILKLRIVLCLFPQLDDTVNILLILKPH